MVKQELLNWEGDRWSITVAGVRRYVGPRTLKRAYPALFRNNTREGSREAANAWWEAQQVNQPAPEPVDYVKQIEDARTVKDWYQQQAVVSDLGLKATFVRAMLDSPEAPILPPTDTDAYSDAVAIFEKKDAILAVPSVPKDRTLEAQLTAFLKRKATQAEMGERSHGRYDALRCHLNVFKAYYGASNSVEGIASQTLLDFHTYLLDGIKEKRFGRDYAAACMRDAKQFIRHLWALELCTLPRNISSKELEISVPRQQIQTFSAAEIKELIAGAPDKLKLYLLLMLNCGMQQQDIADLTPEEIDWKVGRIKRQRSKTRDGDENGTVPTVDYKLWPATFKLLNKLGNKTGPLVLLNEDGKPLKQQHIKDGINRKIDNIRTAYGRLTKKMQIKNPKPLKLIRKTAASTLDGHKDYGRFAPYFLGHAPRSVAARHYVRPSTKQFDAAVAWLGNHFGF
jgi:integrase